MRKILAGLLALALTMGGLPAAAQTTLQAPSIKWAGQYTVPIPSSIISTDTISGLPCIAGSSATCPLAGSAGSLSPATPNTTAALASNIVLKNAAGTLYSFAATADSTLAPTASSVWYLMFFDATAKPTDGAVTPKKCYQVTGSQTGGTLAAGGISFLTGITEVASTTGCYTLTASAHAFLTGDVQ